MCESYTYETYKCSHKDITGWRRPIRCLKLQVIFRKKATNQRALLQKMTYTDKALYDSTPPCSSSRSREEGRCSSCHKWRANPQFVHLRVEYEISCVVIKILARVVRVRNGAVVRDTDDGPPPSSCIYEWNVKYLNIAIPASRAAPAGSAAIPIIINTAAAAWICRATCLVLCPSNT